MSGQRTHGSVEKENVKRKNVNIFLYISFNTCFWCSKEPAHRGGSFEYSQHMFRLRNKKNNFELDAPIPIT